MVKSFLFFFRIDQIEIILEVTNDPHRLFCPHVDCGYVLSLADERRIHKERPMTCTKVRMTSNFHISLVFVSVKQHFV